MPSINMPSMNIPSIISSNAHGIVRSPNRSDQAMLKTRGRFFGRLIQWIKRQLPGGNRRLHKANGAIRQFILQRYGSHVEMETLSSIMDDHISKGHPITGQQVRDIARSVQQFIDLPAWAHSDTVSVPGNDGVGNDGGDDGGDDIPELSNPSPIVEVGKRATTLSSVANFPVAGLAKASAEKTASSASSVPSSSNKN